MCALLPSGDRQEITSRGCGRVHPLPPTRSTSSSHSAVLCSVASLFCKAVTPAAAEDAPLPPRLCFFLMEWDVGGEGSDGLGWAGPGWKTEGGGVCTRVHTHTPLCMGKQFKHASPTSFFLAPSRPLATSSGRGGGKSILSVLLKVSSPSLPLYAFKRE